MDDQADYHSKTTLTTGDFAFIPANIVHAFQIHNTTKVFGVGTRRVRAVLPRDGPEDRR